jgi:ABC-type sugar transport system ATPase subunit
VKSYDAFDSENSHNLHNLISRSPVDGWAVIYVGNSFMNASNICDTVEKLRDMYVYHLMNNNQCMEFTTERIHKERML